MSSTRPSGAGDAGTVRTLETRANRVRARLAATPENVAGLRELFDSVAPLEPDDGFAHQLANDVWAQIKAQAA